MTAKTLSFLRRVKDDGFTNLYNINIDECIKEIEDFSQLEEAMKPKTCEGCKYKNDYYKKCEVCKRNYEYFDFYVAKDNA